MGELIMPNNPLPSVEVSITGDVTNLIDTTITHPAETVITTLESIWSLIFGNIDQLSKKVNIKRTRELELYKESLFIKTSKIPEEFITEPKMKIVGPALDASKYFYEDSYYREMFTNLISASMDKRVNNQVHPAFTEFIKQITPDEARFLANVKKQHVTFVPVAKFKFSGFVFKGDQYLDETNSFLLPSEFLNEVTSINGLIDNLTRLRIIEYTFDKKLTQPGIYDYASKSQLYLDTQQFREIAPNLKIDLSYGIISFTSLGKDFFSLVL